MSAPARSRRRLSVVLLVLSVVLVGCRNGVDGLVEWRDLDVSVPGGWLVIQQRDDLLHLSNEDLSAQDLQSDVGPNRDPNSYDVVGAQLTTDGTSTADAWRALIAAEDGEIEVDTQVQVGGVPATSIQFRWTTNGVPTRERVVIVPSRELVILLQPVPVNGQTTGPDVYLAHVEEFDELLASIVFGAPRDY